MRSSIYRKQIVKGVFTQVGTGLPEALGNLARKAIRARPRPLGRAFGQFVGESKISILAIHFCCMDQINGPRSCMCLTALLYSFEMSVILSTRCTGCLILRIKMFAETSLWFTQVLWFSPGSYVTGYRVASWCIVCGIWHLVALR